MSDTGYDVFLSYNSADKAAVEEIATKLHELSLRPFFDVWHMIPGETAIHALEKAMDQSTTIAVFVGASGAGPWQEEERQLALTYGVKSGGGRRIIPVLMSDAQPKDVPGFLRTRTWVELRLPGGFEKLVAGIQGKAPGPSTGPSAASGAGVHAQTSAPSPSPPSPTPSSTGPTLQEITDELARVFYDRDQAVLVATRAGFPRSRVPNFSTSSVFWHRVMSEAHNGVLMGGIQPIVNEAARQFPANPIFARARS